MMDRACLEGSLQRTDFGRSSGICQDSCFLSFLPPQLAWPPRPATPGARRRFFTRVQVQRFGIGISVKLSIEICPSVKCAVAQFHQKGKSAGQEQQIRLVSVSAGRRIRSLRCLSCFNKVVANPTRFSALQNCPR